MTQTDRQTDNTWEGGAEEREGWECVVGDRENFGQMDRDRDRRANRQAGRSRQTLTDIDLVGELDRQADILTRKMKYMYENLCQRVSVKHCAKFR